MFKFTALKCYSVCDYSFSSILAVDCGPLEQPLNGVLRIFGTTLANPARYDCNIGFQIVGFNIRVCLENGSWSGTAPRCESMYIYLYVCVYVLYRCIYVCMYICVYVCMYVRMYVCMYVHMYLCV